MGLLRGAGSLVPVDKLIFYHHLCAGLCVLVAVARQAKYQYLESVQICARFGSRRRRIFDNDLSVEHACGCRRRSKGLGHLAYAKLPLPDVWRAVAKSGRTIVNDKAQPAQIRWSDDGNLVLG